MQYPNMIQIKTVGIGFYDGKDAHIKWVEPPSLKQNKTETRSKGKCGFSLIESGNE